MSNKNNNNQLNTVKDDLGVNTSSLEPANTPGALIDTSNDDRDIEVRSESPSDTDTVSPSDRTPRSLSESFNSVMQNLNGSEMYSKVIELFKDANCGFTAGYVAMAVNSNKLPAAVVSSLDEDSTGSMVILPSFNVVIASSSALNDLASTLSLTELKRNYKFSQEPSLMSTYMRTKAAMGIQYWETKIDGDFAIPDTDE